MIFRTRTYLEDSYKGHKMMLEKMREHDEEAVEALVKGHIVRALHAFKEESQRKEPSSVERVLLQNPLDPIHE